MILKIIGMIMVVLVVTAHTRDLIKAHKANGYEVTTAGRIGYLIAEAGFIFIIFLAIWS